MRAAAAAEPETTLAKPGKGLRLSDVSATPTDSRPTIVRGWGLEGPDTSRLGSFACPFCTLRSIEIRADQSVRYKVTPGYMH